MNLIATPARLSTLSATFDRDFQKRLHWSAETDSAIEQRVADILADVQRRGDEAVLAYTERFDALSAPSVQALELTQVLTDLQARDGSLDWFFVSPAAGFGGYAPGERTGHYRLGGDVLLSDEDGNSEISGADFAIALVDELEKAGHSRRRFTVAY